MESTATLNSVPVRVCPNPFTTQKIDYAFGEGLTIAQMLDLADVPDYVSVLVAVDGDYVLAENFKHVVPSGGSIVTIRAVPTGGGGGGKNPLRTLLTIAVVAAAVYFPATLAFQTAVAGISATGISAATMSFAQAAASFAIMTVGMLAVNAIAPPPIPTSLSNTQQTYKDSPSYSLSGARNQLAPYGVIPMLLGRHRITPPYGATPYTENLGDDQYLRCLFCIGYGKIIYSDHQIGETAISSFSGVEIETRDGSDSTNTTLYPGDVYQDDLSITLVQADGFSQRTTQPNTTTISVDITWPRGLVKFNDDGSRSSVNSQVEVQYSVKDAADWKGVLSGTSFGVRSTSTSSINSNVEFVYQNEALIMDKFSGALSIISNGEYAYDSGGNYLYGNTEYPIIPSWAWGLARWKLYGSSVYGTTTLTNLTDIRDASFVSAGYFAVTNPSLLNLSVAAGTLTTDVFNITAQTTSAIRRSVAIPVASGQYDVRVRRVSADTVSDRIIDTVAWTALRSFQTGQPITESNMARVALRIKATDQLNSAIDEYNCVGQLVCPDYNSTTRTWVDRATSNPASLYRYVLQGPANKRPKTNAEVDLTKLEEWHAYCEDNGFTFNHYFDYRTSVDAVLQMVAAAGRAAPAYIDGKYSVVIDKVQANIAQHFTPRNSWGYSYNKIFNDRPHAFRVKFWNKDADWREDERIVYDDGYSSANATLFEELSLPGITTADLAWKHGRYHIATARLRPETHTFYTDFEYLTCTRGDRIKFSNDVISVGLGYGRVKSYTDDTVNVLTITLDEELTIESGKTYQIRVRQHDGTSLSIPISTVAGISKTVTVNGAWPIANAPDIDALALFGESTFESIDLIVKNIASPSDFTAQLTCIAYAPEVHDADTGTIPTFQTNITTTTDRYLLYIPQFTLRSDENVLIVSGDSFFPRIVATIQSQNIPPGIVDKTEFRYRLSNTSNPYSYSETTTNEASLEFDIVQDKNYEIQARYYIDGNVGSWSEASYHTVEGLSNNPSDVTNFQINVLGETAYLSWNAVTDVDLSHYVIKFSPMTSGATWGAASTIVEKVGKPATSITVPAMTGTYLIKAVDKSSPPLESVNATSISTSVYGLEQFNVVSLLTEDPTFAGTKTNCEVVGSSLRLSSVDTMEDWTSLSSVVTLYYGVNGITTSGLYNFYNTLDLGNVYSSRLTSSITASGINVANFMSGWTSLLVVESLSGADPSQWSILLELRTTNDDPLGTPTWSSWSPFIVGDYSARAFEFRLNLYSTASNITPGVSALAVSIDMPDRVYGDDDVICPNTGLNVTFAPAFKAKPAIAVSGQNMATGDYYVVTNQSATGFTINFYDSTNTGIQRTFDYVAKGYGFVN